MPRPPKRMNPGSRRSLDDQPTGRVFRKGRFAGRVRPEEGPDPTYVEVDGESTETANASFPAASAENLIVAVPADERRPPGELTSKYDARPSSGAPLPVTDESRDDVVVDLTADGRFERKVIVDLTKLPPVDESQASETVFIRHSEGWPVAGD